MVKKLLTFGMLAGLLAVATTSYAQETQEYPRYGFWSNWSLGVSVDFAKQANHGWTFGDGTSVGANLIIEKELNHVWALRLSAGMPAIYAKENPNSGAVNPNREYDRYGVGLVGFKFSINNAIMGYNPERRGSLYLYAGAGIGILRGEAWPHKNASATDHRVAITGAAGLGYSYKVCEHSLLFIEAMVDDKAFVPNIFKHRSLMDFYVSLGYTYNFGLTAADQEIKAQKDALSKENFDALQDENDRLKRDLNDSKAREQKLKDDIARLENQKPVVTNNRSEEVDRLQNQINQIKEDQINFYALPFSILYGVDEYKVNDTEMLKLQAVAAVMKDNPDVNFNIYGFCDKSGSDAYNEKLSKKRADEVKRLLVKKYGIAEGRLSTEGMGKTKPFGDSKYAVNRRVSFYRVIE